MLNVVSFKLNQRLLDFEIQGLVLFLMFQNYTLLLLVSIR